MTTLLRGFYYRLESQLCYALERRGNVAQVYSKWVDSQRAARVASLAVPLQTTSDELLLVRLRNHDEHALRELLSRYFDRLSAFSHSLVQRRDLAEEAVSNVFLQLWRRRESLDISGTVRSYLFAAVGNQSLTLRKQQRRHDAVQFDDVPPPQLIDARRTETELIFREFQAEVEALILRLPPRRQLIFRLNRLEGLRYSEIAIALGVSKHTVQNHMVQAIKQLAPDLPELRNSLSQPRDSNKTN